jgi:hypothetical protein
MKTIPLTQGLVALVDDVDFDRASAHKWSATKTKTNVYGVRKARTPAGQTTQLLHRFILGVTDPEIQVDHEDHNGLNCQRNNLRKCVRGENDGNRRKARGSSQYKGVSWSKSKGKWRAYITIERTVHLGYFTDEVQAALAYDAAARIRFGVFSNCNFPLQK